MREVVADVRMREVEAPGRRVVAVALLGHRERHDVHARVGHPAHERARIGRGEHRLAHRSHDARRRAGRVLQEQRVEAILRGERRDRARRLHRDAADAPARIAGQEVVGVDGPVRAVERAQAQVHDAHADRRGVVARPGDRAGQRGERRERKRRRRRRHPV